MVFPVLEECCLIMGIVHEKTGRAYKDQPKLDMFAPAIATKAAFAIRYSSEVNSSQKAGMQPASMHGVPDVELCCFAWS